jgi:cytidylate kinase
MAIITISRGSYSKGKEIAEKVAARLGYECLSRDIVLAASEEFNIPEIKLVRAIHDAPNILDRMSRKKEQYVSFVRTALIQHFRRDNIVYHGLAGQFFIRYIPHVLKVRIIADTEERIKLEMEREGISRDKALDIINKDDEERRKWSQSLYGIDTCDPCRYDLLIHIRKIRVADAVDIICYTAGLDHFKTTPESQKAIEDLALSAQVQSVLLNNGFKTEVDSDDGVVTVKIEGSLSQQQLFDEKITEIASTVKGVTEVRTNVIPAGPYAD